MIAKLEKPQAVENLDEILDRVAGVMIARGDLGVELPPERVPILQGDHQARQSRQADRHRGDPDAGIDDDQPASDAR